MLFKNILVIFSIILKTWAHSTNENIRYSNHYEVNDPKKVPKTASLADNYDCPTFQIMYNKPSTGLEYGYKPEIFGTYSIVNGTMINDKKFYMTQNGKFG